MWWHESTPPPPGTPPAPEADVAEVVDSYVGSALYEVIPEHELALVMALALGVGVWFARRLRPRMLSRIDRLPAMDRMLAWILILTAVIHAGLALGHELSGFTLLYIAGATAPVVGLRRLLAGARWRRVTRIILGGLVLGYAVLSISEPPDSFGITTKLVELTGLAIAARPEVSTRRRELGATLTAVAAAVIVALGGWIGALSSGDGGHHLGVTPPPGVLLPPGEDRPASEAESAAATRLYTETAAAIAKFADPSVARDAGYNVAGLAGTDFHADNPRLKGDDHILDPDAPETLVYAVAASGEPVLLGAMYQMDDVGEIGPAIGGPLTVWHAHDHICLPIPLAISGLTSPFGLCPLGSLTMPITNEMLHVWTVPGLDEEDWFGEIGEQWLADYLATH